MEALTDNQEVRLTLEDSQWLTAYGFDSTILTDPESFANIEKIIQRGSHHLHRSQNDEEQFTTLEARESFFRLIGMDKATLVRCRVAEPTLAPTDTFISLQRLLHEEGLDPYATIKKHPKMIAFSAHSVKCKFDYLTACGLDAKRIAIGSPQVLGAKPESIKARLDNLTALGLDAVAIANAMPSTLGYAAEAVRGKVSNLISLGLNANKVISAHPPAIGYAPETVQNKVDYLTTLGLEAVKLINTRPPILALTIESITARIDNIASLGLDAFKLINADPRIMSLSPQLFKLKFMGLESLNLDAKKIITANPRCLTLAHESIVEKMNKLARLGLDPIKMINGSPALTNAASESTRRKVHLIQRLGQTLKWEGDVLSLLNEFPAMLGTNEKKLLALARIAADKLDTTARSSQVTEIRSTFITPLEKYLITLDEDEVPAGRVPMNILRNAADRNKLSKAERAEKALGAAPDLGKVGASYLRYKN